MAVAGRRSSGMGGEEAAEQARRHSREELAMGALRGEARGEVARRTGEVAAAVLGGEAASPGGGAERTRPKESGRGTLLLCV